MGEEAPLPRAYRIGQAVRRLLQVAPAVHHALAQRVGVGTTDLLALDHITSAPSELGVVELGERLGIRSASTTVLVDRLVATGHVQRLPHATDRRRTSLHPTSSAYDDVRTALGPLIRDIGEITESLEPATADAVLDFLTRIIAALDDFADSTPSGPAPQRSSGDRSAPLEDS